MSPSPSWMEFKLSLCKTIMILKQTCMVNMLLMALAAGTALMLYRFFTLSEGSLSTWRWGTRYLHFWVFTAQVSYFIADPPQCHWVPRALIWSHVFYWMQRLTQHSRIRGAASLFPCGAWNRQHLIRFPLPISFPSGAVMHSAPFKIIWGKL